MSEPNTADALERAACIPVPVDPAGFNPISSLPYGLQLEHIQAAMGGFIDFLGFINGQLHSNGIERLESMLMPANFSSVVGEFVISNIPRYCPALAKNRYHNGHPDLVPAGRFAGNAAQHATDGIEIKASRYLRGWQGHNPEEIWLLVFAFDSNRPADAARGIPPRPFRFVMVVGAQLTQADWRYSGRSETSRRTITASVTRSGYDKMIANGIYRAPEA
jgi:hypothetical protein